MKKGGWPDTLVTLLLAVVAGFLFLIVVNALSGPEDLREDRPIMVEGRIVEP